MAQLTVTIPDALIPRLVAAITARYPDLTGTNAQIGKAGVRELLREVLAQEEEEAARRAGVAAAQAAAEAAREQAQTDAQTIT